MIDGIEPLAPNLSAPHPCGCACGQCRPRVPEPYGSMIDLGKLRQVAYEAGEARRLLQAKGFGAAGVSLVECVERALAERLPPMSIDLDPDVKAAWQAFFAGAIACCAVLQYSRREDLIDRAAAIADAGVKALIARRA